MHRYVQAFRSAVETGLHRAPTGAALQMGGRLAVLNGMGYGYFKADESVRPQYLQQDEFVGHRIWAVHASGLLVAGKPAAMTIVSDGLDEHHLTQQLEFGEEIDGRPMVTLRRTLGGDDTLREANNWARVPSRNTGLYARIESFPPHDMARIEHAVAVTALRRIEIVAADQPDIA